MRRRRYQIALIIGLILLMLLAFWVVYLSGSPQPRFRVAFGAAHGHFPEPALVVGDQLSILWVTNIGRSAITLEMPYVQFENAAGGLGTDHGPSWNAKGDSALSPGSAAWLATGFEPDRKRLKFVFEYRQNGNAFLKAISKAIAVLPLKRLPQRTHDWLRQNGLVDGFVYGHYEGPWIANPQAGANRGQPSGPGTNRASASAGPGRSR